MPAFESLSIVIPVWNDAKGLIRLLPQISHIRRVERVIVVDDASAEPVSPESLGIPKLADTPLFLWLRNEIQGGAGHARNKGLKRVDTSHVLFFDSDDQILPELDFLIEELIQSGRDSFDFVMFRHIETGRARRGEPGPFGYDQWHWDRAAIVDEIVELRPDQASQLSRTSCYPWNKIYRTGFIREEALSFTEIPVHNDVEFHWRSFLAADSILATSRLCAEHGTNAEGDRLTNRTGRERLQVFTALTAVQTALLVRHDRISLYSEPVVEFYLRLLRWIEERLNLDVRAEFRVASEKFLWENISPPLLTLVALENPMIAAELNDYLAELSI
jgi:glycosyltransferase involved in cell wall biosynthesis